MSVREREAQKGLTDDLHVYYELVLTLLTLLLCVYILYMYMLYILCIVSYLQYLSISGWTIIFDHVILLVHSSLSILYSFDQYYKPFELEQQSALLN